MKERNCVIVDAYSTGRYLPEEFKRYGIGTVHVMSAAQIPRYSNRISMRICMMKSFAPASAWDMTTSLNIIFRLSMAGNWSSLSRAARPELS